MPVPALITDLNVSEALNSPPGSETLGANMDNYLRAQASFIAQLNANKIDKAGTVTPTADQPMGGFSHTGAGAATVAGEYLVYGQTGGAIDNLIIGTVFHNKAQQLVGNGTLTTTLPVAGTTAYGGGLLVVRGADSGGVAFCALYLVAAKLVGGSGATTAATLVARAGSASPTLAISDNGSFITVTTSAGGNLTYVFGVGFG